MPKKLLMIASALMLASSLSYCGTNAEGDPPLLDAGVEEDQDAGHPGADAGGEGFDAGTQRACESMTLPAGNHLSLTCDGQTIDLDTEMTAFYDSEDKADYFYIFSSDEDARYTMVLTMYSRPSTCPAAFPLPWGSVPSPIDWFITEPGTESDLLGDAVESGSRGHLILDGFKLSSPRELSFSCNDCVLVGAPDAQGNARSCTLNGTFRATAPEL